MEDLQKAKLEDADLEKGEIKSDEGADDVMKLPITNAGIDESASKRQQRSYAAQAQPPQSQHQLPSLKSGALKRRHSLTTESSPPNPLNTTPIEPTSSKNKKARNRNAANDASQSTEGNKYFLITFYELERFTLYPNR